MNNKDELDIRRQFDSYIKKCIRNFAFNYKKKNVKKWNNNTMLVDDFSNFASEDIISESLEDCYFSEGKIYDVNGTLIKVTNPNIIEALEHLPCEQRNIILLYYFEDETERQIANSLNLLQQTVNRRRKAALELMKSFLDNSYE